MTTNKVKTFGPALIAAVALGAYLAPTAVAQQGVLTSDGPVTVVGTQIGESSENAFTGFGALLECETSAFTGHAIEETPHGFIPPGAEQATGTPHYGNCAAQTALGTLPMTVEMTSCDYSLTVGETAENEEEYELIGDIVCDEEDAIHVVFFNDAEHTETLCNVTLEAQAIEGAARLSEDEGHLVVSGGFSGIHAERSGVCLLDGKGSTTNQAATDFHLTGRGINELGELTEMSISE